MDERDRQDERETRGLPEGLTGDIAALATVMTEHGLHAIEIEAHGIRVSLTGAKGASAAPNVHTTEHGAASISASTVPMEAEEQPTTYDFLSPMIGTFYVAPGPTEEPFVRVGDHVTSGKTVALIEAMKINNEIQIDRNGTVVEIYVSNGQPVEFNQKILRLSLG